MNNCEHRRIKKNYPFGRKSNSQKVCKDCGEIVTNKMLEKARVERQKKKQRFRRW